MTLLRQGIRSLGRLQGRSSRVREFSSNCPDPKERYGWIRQSYIRSQNSRATKPSSLQGLQKQDTDTQCTLFIQQNDQDALNTTFHRILSHTQRTCKVFDVRTDNMHLALELEPYLINRSQESIEYLNLAKQEARK